MQIPAVQQATKAEAVESDLTLSPPGLERILFIHYKKGFGKPSWAGGGKKEEKEPNCYDFLGKGVKWRWLPVNYVINPTNPDGLDPYFVSDTMGLAADAWDDETTSGLFGGFEFDEYADWDGNSPDGRNEIVFGNYPEYGVIAVAVVWGYFSGPPSIREILEFDIMFDTDYDWGDAAPDPGLMDLRNIATHEIGHGVGLADLYENSCADETMYGYSAYGDINKRTLNAGDIKGIQQLYGQ